MIGHLHKIKHTTTEYVYHRVLVYIENDNGRVHETLLLTDSDLEKIRRRSDKNIDMLMTAPPRMSLLQRLLAAFKQR